MFKIYLALLLFVFIVGGLSQQYSGESSAFFVSRKRVPRTSKELFLLAAAVLIFVAGCRYHVGADFGAYYLGYQQYVSEFWTALKTFDEPGLRFIYWLVVKIRDSGAACIFAAAAVTLGLELRFVYKNTDQIVLALLLFVLIVWDACFNGIRQALAVSVLCCGFPCLKKGKFIPYAISVFFAFLCHRSAVVMILPWFVCRRKITGKHLLFLVGVSVIALASTDRLFQVVGWIMDESTGVSAMMEIEYWTRSVNTWRVVAYMAPAVFFLIAYWKKERAADDDFYINILLIHGLAAVISSFSACIARITMYTAPYEIIAIPELLKKFSPRNKQLITFLIILLYAIFAWYGCKGGSWHWIWNR